MELVTPQLGVCILYKIGVNFTRLSPGGADLPFRALNSTGQAGSALPGGGRGLGGLCLEAPAPSGAAGGLEGGTLESSWKGGGCSFLL